MTNTKALADVNQLLRQTESSDTDTLGKHMRQLVQLRWVAVLGQLLTILVTHYGFGVTLPIQTMLSILAGLIAFNALTDLSLRFKRRVYTAELFMGLLVDMGTLTAQLFFSGGATNPFVFLYLLQVCLAAVLMAQTYTWVLLGVAALCFLWLAEAGLPIDLPQDYHLGIRSYYLEGMFICLVLNAGLLVVFINRINQTHREHDARLAELRQRAAEEEHILRMGLLASGAAHELGTPLATIAVILGDWRRMPALNADPDLDEEITEMQTQVQRCKSIVSGILMSAGETRGESSGETSVCSFFEELLIEWQSTRKVDNFEFENNFGDDVDIASDTVFKQTICNLLDNALDASPNWIGLTLSRQEDNLLIRVTDRGPGFAKEVFDRLGQPYQSTKGRPGSGLGLFLVFNVARILGGQVRARNRQEGGAEISLRLPLAAIQLKEV
ncbi:Sensor histidine kinase RegB [Zhongshania aliphaticivorans]|uniref:histidine kinase n=1 Tax=Zhongshania aliphaticivorans TaxID=1470434 RepID=A0A5S9NWV8_9GAMM|nr:ATP-binding protein [Zhongshania aliphaticivorans]CAA0095281.1 Sensor histidine kinase RegB [Zhongshania aliphaticivorans]CAA0113089.1 Sensor histidine kinase RegB [Zhongshania aliphaticivorans]